MTIKTRLYLLVIIACMGLVGEGIFCLMHLSRVYSTVNYVNINTVPSILAIDNFADRISRMRAYTWHHLLLSNSKQKDQMNQQILAIRASADTALKDYEKYVTDDIDRHMLADVRSSLVAYDDLRVRVIQLSRAEKNQEARDLIIANQHTLDRLFSAVENHRAYNAKLGSDSALQAEAVQESADVFTLLIMLLTMLIVGFIGILTARSIIRNLEKLQLIVEDVTKTSDFSRRINIAKQDEIGLTALAFDQLMEAQQCAISQVNSVVTSISEGDFNPRVVMDLQGDLGVMKQAVNASAQRIKETMDELVGITTALCRGEFDQHLGSNAKGKFRQTVDQAMQAMQGIQTMLDDIGQVMHGVAQGDLRNRVGAEGLGDFAKLKDNINLSLNTLGQALSAIDANTYQVAIAAKQSSTAIEQISDGARGQMHAISQILIDIRQTACSIAEVTGNAEVASQKTREAVNIVCDGKNKMEKMVALVTGIVTHSQRINKITEVIEKFANKTNMLSLNAAIEAARAGEQGKGFAVVADEVGKLSVHSAESAHEIANLIQEAVAEANRALLAVQEVSTDMERIEGSSLQADDMMQRISAALEQQSTAVQNVQANIADLNKIAESNAAASEHITSMSVELSKIAADTRREVEKFQI